MDKKIKYKQNLELIHFREAVENIPINFRALITKKELDQINKERESPINEENFLTELLSTKLYLNEEYLSQHHYALAIGCEMVSGERGCTDVIARVTIVNYYGYTIFDKYVEPTHNVTDYRTRISGIRKGDLVDAPSFEVVRQHVSFLIRNKRLVGHKVFKDLEALKINHPSRLRKDIATPFSLSRNIDQRISIKNLCFNLFDIKILEGCHNTETEALASMAVYRKLQHLE